MAFTLAGSPVSVDVTANDFVKHMDHLEVTKTWGSEHGSFEVLGRTVRYVPVPSYAGPDSCKYEICQGGQCNRRGRPSRGGDGDEGGQQDTPQQSDLAMSSPRSAASSLT